MSTLAEIRSHNHYFFFNSDIGGSRLTVQYIARAYVLWAESAPG